MSAPVHVFRHTLRWIAAIALYYGGAVAMLRRSRRRRGPSVLVLRYHRVFESGDEPRLYRLGVPVASFQRQIDFLSRNYHIVDLRDAARVLLDGQEPAGGRSDGGGGDRPARAGNGPLVVITFDDGYADNLPVAMDLARRDIPSTIFVVSGAVDEGRSFFWERLAVLYERAPSLAAVPDGRRRSLYERAQKQLKEADASVREERLAGIAAELGLAGENGELERDRPLTWEETRALRQAGVGIGAHTVTHPLLTLLPDEDVGREIRVSMERIEEVLGEPVDSFAYPSGDWDARVRDIAAQCGLEIAVTCRGGVNAPGEDLLALRRKGIGERVGQSPFGGFSRALWAAEIEGVFDWLRGGAAGRQ